MCFENYANGILALSDCDIFEKPKADAKQLSRLTVIDGEMQQRTKILFFRRYNFVTVVTSLFTRFK